MNSLRKLISQIKWYEYLYMISFYATIIAIGIVFKSNIIVILNSFFGITATFLNAKGLWLGGVFAIIQVVFYTFLNIQNQFYGEIIVCWCAFVPLNIATIFTWLKNRGKNEVVNVSKKVSWKELVVAIGTAVVGFVAIYFLLRALNTANLILSTAIFVFTMLSMYFLIRRSEVNFFISIIKNSLSFMLWFSLVINGNLNYIPTILNYVIYIILNICGIINWLKLKKQEVGSFDVIMDTLKKDL